MEILISLDGAEPPVGWVQVVRGPARGAARRGEGQEVRFAGWLGLLRALYEVTGSSSPGPPGEA